MGLVLLVLSETCEERFAAWGSSQLGSSAQGRDTEGTAEGRVL